MNRSICSVIGESAAAALLWERSSSFARSVSVVKQSSSLPLDCSSGM